MTERFLPIGISAGRLGERAEKLAHYMSCADPNAVYRAQHSHWASPSETVIGGVEPKGISWNLDLIRDVPDFTARMQLMDALQYLPDDVLTKVDRATMANGLEARVPLLDHRLVEFAWRLPAGMKRREGNPKWILRHILYNYVPRGLIDRPKKGFAAPIASWLRGPLREWSESLLEPTRLANEGYFAPEPLGDAWREFLRGRDDLREPLWGALMFQAWLEANHSLKRPA
jgi:asparagine synthase (glutamine-hydrolysing)